MSMINFRNAFGAATLALATMGAPKAKAFDEIALDRRADRMSGYETTTSQGIELLGIGLAGAILASALYAVASRFGSSTNATGKFKGLS